MSTIKANQWLNTDGTENFKCRAWVNFNGTGTVAIRASGNVSSITDNGVGDFTINFINAMIDTFYSFGGSIWDSGGGGTSCIVFPYQSVGLASNSVRVRTIAGTTPTDFPGVFINITR
jgi:hypothetical protein